MRQMHNVLAPIWLGEAIAFGTLGINVDITDRKRAEAELSHALGALRASNEKLQMAVDGTGIGLWSWDVQADVVVWDKRLCAIYGVDPEKAPRTRAEYYALLAPADRERSASALAQGLCRGTMGGRAEHLADGRGLAVGAHHGGRAADGRSRRRRRRRDPRCHRSTAPCDEQLSGRSRNWRLSGSPHRGHRAQLQQHAHGDTPRTSRWPSKKAPPEIAPLLASAEGAASRAADLVRQLMAYAWAQSAERALGPRVYRRARGARGLLLPDDLRQTHHHPRDLRRGGVLVHQRDADRAGSPERPHQRPRRGVDAGHRGAMHRGGHGVDLVHHAPSPRCSRSPSISSASAFATMVRA